MNIAAELKPFFEEYRKVFNETINSTQASGIVFLLSKFRTDTDITDIRIAAYLLATTKHETANTFQPVTERGKLSYFDQYEPPSQKAKAIGNKIKGEGYKFRGRGYAQITGRANYEKFSLLLLKAGFQNLAANPEIALQPNAAYLIMKHGILNGMFTGVGIKRYINNEKNDYINARKTVNGTDKAELIASYAEKFILCLKTIAI